MALGTENGPDFHCSKSQGLKKLTAQKQAAFLFKSYTPGLVSILVLVEDITSSAEPMIYSCVSIHRSPSKDKLDSVAVPWKLMLWTYSFFPWKLVVSQAFAPWDSIHNVPHDIKSYAPFTVLWV